jgi:cell division protein FtsW
MEPYRLERIVGFLNPYADELGVGYHPLQSLRTIASGGWLGVGLGAGIQKHGYLPESQTDFIFAIICEEAGLIGGLLVIGLFLVLVWLGLRTMWTAQTRFERLLAFGLTTLIGLQAAMHIAVVTVCAPTTGISLPLISAGGSGLLISCVAIGLLAAIAARGPAAQESRAPAQRFRVNIEPA